MIFIQVRTYNYIINDISREQQLSDTNETREQKVTRDDQAGCTRDCRGDNLMRSKRPQKLLVRPPLCLTELELYMIKI